MSIDSTLLDQAREIVDRGGSESISALVNDAVRERLAHEARLAALDELLADYEAEHGAFADEELAERAQRDRDAAAATRAKRRSAA